MLRAIVSGIANGGIYGLLAVGIVLVYRGSRVLNFAQAELGTFGLFVTLALVDGLHFPWAIAALGGLIASGIIGLLFERFVVRRMGDASRLSVAVATIGLFLLLFSVELKIWGVSPRVLDPPIGGLGVKVFGFYLSPTYMLALVTMVVAGIALTAFLTRTDFGLGVLAASQDANAVRLVGVRLSRVSAFTWALGAMVGCVAALLIEPSIGGFTPGFMTVLFVDSLAAALLGGLNNLTGAFVGGIVIGVTEAFVAFMLGDTTFPGIKLVAVFVIIIGVLMFRPQGLLVRAKA